MRRPTAATGFARLARRTSASGSSGPPPSRPNLSLQRTRPAAVASGIIKAVLGEPVR